jgi:hypothetical protein
MTDIKAPPSNLRTLSRFMAGLTTIGLLIYPIGDIAVYLRPQHTQWLMLDADHMGGLINGSVPLAYRLCALAFSMVGVSFTIWALWSLRRLFLHYSRGDVFSADALRLMKNIAIAIFAGVIVTFVMHAPISLALTWYLGHGHREISLDFGSGDVASLFTAGVVLVISRVMAEAQRAADENTKFA